MISIIGSLTIHGVIKNVQIPASLQVKSGAVLGIAHFQVKPEDYNISIPSIVREKIAPVMDVNVNITCNPVK